LGKKIFINPTFDSGLISKTYEELKKLATKTSNNPTKGGNLELNQEFTTKDSQMTEKHFKSLVFKSLVIRKMQIKMTLRFFNLTPVKMAKFKTSGGSTCWQGCEERGTLLHCY